MTKSLTDIKKRVTSNWGLDLLFLTIIIALLFGLFLGHRPLSVPDEARYAEIPREMIALSNYITPHLNYIKYFEKPALFYWLQAASIHLLGVNEWAIRIPNALMALLGCLATYGIGRILFNRQTGLIASLILASSALYFVLSHLVTLDMATSVLMTVSLFFFLAGTKNSEQNLRKRFLYYGFYIFCALAVLTKGLIGVIFPAMIIGSWILLLNEWRLLKTIYLPSGILLFLMITIPWHVLVQLHNPEFFHFYFIEQQFLRYLTDSTGRYKPAWFFIPVLIVGFLPWIVFLPQAIKNNLTIWRERHEKKFSLFIGLWATLIFIFFSFSNSKLIPYILPIFPPLAIIIADTLVKSWQTPKNNPGIQWGYSLLAALIFFGGIGTFFVHWYFPIPVLNEIKIEIISIWVIWSTGTALACWLQWKKLAKPAFCALLLSTLAVLFMAIIAMPKVDDRPIQPLVKILQPVLHSEDEVASYGTYYQDLPFYLQRRITVVDYQNELDFGIQHQDTREWIINQATFWQRWKSNRSIYMITDLDTYKQFIKSKIQPLHVLGLTTENVLISNH